MRHRPYTGRENSLPRGKGFCAARRNAGDGVPYGFPSRNPAKTLLSPGDFWVNP